MSVQNIQIDCTVNPLRVISVNYGNPGLPGPPGPTAVSADTGNAARLGSDALIFVPPGGVPGPHQATHHTGGADQIPVATSSSTGLVPILSNVATQYLSGTGAWSTPAGGGSGDMLKSVYDINNDGIVDQAAAVPWTGVSGKPATFAPSAHATSHESGGADAIPLDTLAAPTDVTTLNATLTAHGLLPKLGGGTGNFLRADGTWASPPAGGGGGDMLKSVYDANNDSIVDHAALSDTAPWTGITGKPATFPPSAHGSTHAGGGTDPVPVATTTVAGLVPAKPNAGINATTTQVVMGDDTRLSDARIPSAHQASHVSGTDQIPLPTTTVKGLCPPLDGNAAHFLSGAGTCIAPPAAAPAAHAATHEAGGSDTIPLDTLAVPTDITALNASTTAHGLMPKANGSANSFYGADATQKQVTYAMLGGTQPAPLAHAASHVTGTDQIASASATARGLLAQLSGATTDYVGGDNACHALPAVPAASSTTPAMDGTAAIGVGTTYARADHVHPSDTSRVATTRQILTTQSITGGGDLSADRTLTLVGDVVSPGNSMVYGTSSSGIRGWQAASAGGASPMNVQPFNVGSGQTWTKPGGSPTLVRVYAFGTGGGGGGGAIVLNVNNDHAGGGGGGGGGCSIADFLPSQLPATVTVNVGAGGNGGAAGSGTTNLLGNNGNAGGATSFGTYLSAGGGNGGIGGNQAGSNTPAAGGAGLYIGGAGGLQALYNTQTSTAGAQGTQYGSSGGGGGGNYYSAPASGGNMTLTSTGGGTVTTSGGSPVAGGIGGNPSGLSGAAGGGGGYVPLSVAPTNGANGGAGGSYGGGGGGGSAAVTSGASQTSGAGGKGGDGYVVVLTYF